MNLSDIFQAIRANRIRVTSHARKEAQTDELTGENEMMPFPKCPICGGEMIHKTVKEIVPGGGNTAIVAVEADVCLHCGERLYTPETIAFFETISARLEKKETQGFQKIGAAYSVPAA